MEGWGYHFLASESPLPNPTAAELAQRLPAKAATDFLEWGPETTAAGQFSRVLKNEISLDDLIAQVPAAPDLQDDAPVNEYYVMRHRKGSRQ